MKLQKIQHYYIAEHNGLKVYGSSHFIALRNWFLQYGYTFFHHIFKINPFTREKKCLHCNYQTKEY